MTNKEQEVIIQKQQEEIEKKDKIIEKMAEELAETYKADDMCDNCHDEEQEDYRCNEEFNVAKCLIEYFERKVEE